MDGRHDLNPEIYYNVIFIMKNSLLYRSSTSGNFLKEFYTLFTRRAIQSAEY